MKQVMRVKLYKNKFLNKHIESKLLQAEKDYENNKVIDGEEIFDEWKRKYRISN